MLPSGRYHFGNRTTSSVGEVVDSRAIVLLQSCVFKTAILLSGQISLLEPPAMRFAAPYCGLGIKEYVKYKFHLLGEESTRINE